MRSSRGQSSCGKGIGVSQGSPPRGLREGRGPRLPQVGRARAGRGHRRGRRSRVRGVTGRSIRTGSRSRGGDLILPIIHLRKIGSGPGRRSIRLLLLNSARGLQRGRKVAQPEGRRVTIHGACRRRAARVRVFPRRTRPALQARRRVRQLTVRHRVERPSRQEGLPPREVRVRPRERRRPQTRVRPTGRRGISSVTRTSPTGLLRRTTG